VLQRRSISFSVALGGIAAVAFALRLAYVLSFSKDLHFGLDSLWYKLSAANIAAGRGFVDPARFYRSGSTVATAFRPPLYSAFLAMVIKAVDNKQQTFQIAGCIVGAITVVLIGLLGRRLGGNAVGLCAAVLAALSPALIGFDASVMSENIYVPLVTAALLAVYAAIDRPAWPRWGLVGMLIGASMLTRGDALLMLPIVVVPAAIVARRTDRWRLVIPIVAAVIGAAIVVGPWLVRNDARVGEPTLATLDTGTAIAGSNCATTYSGATLGSWSNSCTNIQAHPGDNEVTVNHRLINRGLRYARSHLTRVPVVVAVRVLRLWGLWDPPGEVRLESPESRNVTWQQVTLFAYAPVAGLAGYGLFLMRRQRERLVPLLSVLASVTLAAALTYGKQRFRAAAEPVLLVSAAIAVVQLARRGHGSSDSTRRDAGDAKKARRWLKAG
jgi:4-amino-4-deoxy-L-arabinose transferase-like glycosyltransferase